MKGDDFLNLRKALHGELKNFIVNVGWTHKIHIVYSDHLLFWSKFWNLVEIITAAITASGLVTIILGNGSFAFNVAVGVISFISLCSKGVNQTLEFSSRSIKEKQDANQYWNLREEAQSLLYEVKFCIGDPEDIKKKYDLLSNMRIQYNKDLTNVPRKVVDQASKFIKEKRDTDYREDYEYFISGELMDFQEEEEINN